VDRSGSANWSRDGKWALRKRFSAARYSFAQQQFVIDEAGHEGQQACPLKSIAHGRRPGFSKRIYGFWDGGQMFRVRVVAPAPGTWTWTSGSNQPADTGLNRKSGRFAARNWAETDKQANPNRRGFLRSTPNGHAHDRGLSHLGLRSVRQYVRRSQWHLPAQCLGSLRRFSRWQNADCQSHARRQGYRSFEILPNRDGLADTDRVVRHYFQSLDRKMQYLSDQGFIPMLETIRRDVAPPWMAYFKFNESFSRFVEYIAARYGAYNFIFSKVHFDIYLKNYSITGAEFNEALN
jgi:Domain of unknown function (DUF5060)